MEVSFLTPAGALLALGVAAPLAILRARQRRVGAVSAGLGLGLSPRRHVPWHGGALAAVCALFALAAAQPVVATTRIARERTDAQLFLVVDASRSMLASARPGAATRFARALDIGERLTDQFRDVPVGVASLTDRLLPHLFPTTDRRVLAATLRKTLSVESPGPSNVYSTRATTFDALTAAPSLNYFPGSARKRVLVVLTDGETRPLEEDLALAFRRQPRIHVVFVHIWQAHERIYLTGVAEFGYSADPSSEAVLARVASSIGGRVFSESDGEALRRHLMGVIGSGPTERREHEGHRLALMPWITLLGFAPLCVVLYRRNL